MPDLLADLGRASLEAFWWPVALWTAVALVAEAALRLGRAPAALGLPVRGAVLAALPVAVAVPAALAALAPSAVARALAAAVPDVLWLPEVAVGAAPAPVEAAGPAVPEVLAGAAVVLAAVVGLVHVLWLGRALLSASASRRSLAAAGPEERRAVDEAAAALAVARPVEAAEAPAGVAPFTVGWRRPLVALPPGLAPAAREVAALHEVAHVRRADYAWHAAQRGVQALFAWHPLVWGLGRGLDLDRERAADALVVEACPEHRRAYADLLLSFAALPAPPLALGAARGASSLKTRIDAMTRPLSPSRFRQLLRLGRALGAAALALVAGLAITASALPPDPAVDSPAPESRTVRGMVVDADSRAPIHAASLQIAGTTVGSATGAEGRFQLEAPEGDQVVVVSAAGYERRAVRLAADQSELNVALTVRNVPPPPPVAAEPGSASAPEIFEVVEDPPRLIGGLNGLMERVVYPQAAKEEGIEGRVIVQFVVNEQGRVQDAVVRDSPDERLSEAALRAVRASEFEPGRQRGIPVKVRFAVPITFRLPASEGSGDRGSNGAGAGSLFYAGLDVSRLTPASRSAFEAAYAELPSRLRAEGVSRGEVRLTYLIDPDGTTRRFRVESGPAAMHEAVVDLARVLVTRVDARPGAPVEGSLRVWYGVG